MINATPSTCQVGAIVRHTGKFCRSIGWNTPPINGIVVEAYDDFRTVRVWFCDDEASQGGTRILIDNLELCPLSNSQINDSFRECLVKEFTEAQKPDPMDDSNYVGSRHHY